MIKKNIPGWYRVPLGELSYRITKGTTPTSLGFNFTDKGILFVKVESISDQRINHALCTYIDPDADEALARSRLQEDDILFSIAGTLGRIGIVHQNDLPANTNQAVSIIRLVKPILPKYIAHFLSSHLLEARIREQRRGVGLQNLNLKQVSEFEIPLPPLNEQSRIVAKIEALKARSQRVKEELEAIPALLDQFRQSVLAAAFRGDLTADWREKNPDVEPASVLLERIRAERRRRWEEAEMEKMKTQGKTPKDDKWKEKYQEPSIPDITDLPSLVNGWAYTFLEPLLSTKRAGLKTGPFGSLLKKHEHRDKGIPVLGIENISSMGFVEGNKIYIDEKKAVELADYDAKEEDVLISRSGTVGEVCVVPSGFGEARISTNLIRVSLVENGMLPEFFCFLFRGSHFIRSQISELCSGSTRDFLNQTILNSLVFPIPPLEEQREIVHRINALFDFSKKIENQVSELTNSLNWLNQSILAKAFRGELVSQDPNDEPASVLLERIRAEREKLNTKKKAKGKTEKKSRKAKSEAAEPEQLSLPGFE